MSRRGRPIQFLVALSIVSAGSLLGPAIQDGSARPDAVRKTHGVERSPGFVTTVVSSRSVRSRYRTTDRVVVYFTGRKIG